MKRLLLILFLLIATIFSGTIPGTAQDLSEEMVPFSMRGSLITSAENYSIPGLQTERPINTARLFFNPTMTVYGVEMPFSFVLSTNERSYNQPFNQFGVSPRYKWFTAHAGYRSLRFSEFTLSDAVILGGGAEVKAEWFHAKGMYGRFRRAVQEDTLSGIRAIHNRTGYALNAGFGSPNNYFDLNFLNAWDDSTSLERPPTFGDVFPGENLIVGASGRVTISEGMLVFDGEAAGSLLTRDTRQPVVADADVAAYNSPLFETRLSSRFNLAFRLAGTFNQDLYSLKLEYARVEPEYESFGSTYTQNDREDVTISPGFRLPDGTLRASGTIGFRHDNLYDDRAYTTDRLISSASLNWTPGQIFGIDGQYSNYSMSSSAGSLQVNDSTRVDNVSKSFSIAPRLTLMASNMQHFLLLFLTQQVYTDENILTGTASDNDVFTTVVSYTGTMASGLGFSGSFQFTQLNTSFLTNIIRGITLGVSKPFLENKLQANLSYTMNFTKASTESATDTQNLLTLIGRYRLSPVDVFELRFQFNSYNAVNPARRSYRGTTSRLQYSRSFQI